MRDKRLVAVAILPAVAVAYLVLARKTEAVAPKPSKHVLEVRAYKTRAAATGFEYEEASVGVAINATPCETPVSVEVQEGTVVLMYSTETEDGYEFNSLRTTYPSSSCGTGCSSLYVDRDGYVEIIYTRKAGGYVGGTPSIPERPERETG